MKPYLPWRLSASARLFAALIWFAATACSAQDSATTPDKFWTEFQAAVMAQDNAKLLHLTSFPLEVRGVDDSQSPKHYNREEFAKVLQRILSQPVFAMKGAEVVTNTMLDVVGTTKVISPADMMTKQSFRVGQLVFEQKGKQWKFSRAYLEE